jgi:hypothetical protein
MISTWRDPSACQKEEIVRREEQQGRNQNFRKELSEEKKI